MNVARLVVDSVMVVGAAAVCFWPGAFPVDTLPVRGFARGMRTFGATVFATGMLAVILLIPGIQTCVEPLTLRELTVAKTALGGVAIGVFAGLVVSGQFGIYFRWFKDRKSKAVQDSGGHGQIGDPTPH